MEGEEEGQKNFAVIFIVWWGCKCEMTAHKIYFPCLRKMSEKNHMFMTSLRLSVVDFDKHVPFTFPTHTK
jgi:hypothetical protein